MNVNGTSLSSKEWGLHGNTDMDLRLRSHMFLL